MSRLIDSFEQILDGSGDPLALGLLDFFVSGSSSTRKKTYADAAETIENTNPVVVGGDGRCPNVFGTGTYNVILRTSAGVQLLARDPVGGSDSLTFGADWVASTSYSATDQVRDDGNYWQSVTNLNQGNQPSLNDGSNWLKTDFLNITVNTLAIAVLDSEKMPKTGGAFSGQVTSTAGDFNIVTNTALSNAAATLTASQLIGGEFTITPTAARIQTLDTAANIISALSGSVTGSNFIFTIVNLAAFDVTIATATGVTLVGNMVVNDGNATFRVRRLNASTVSVTRLEKANYSTGVMIVRDEKSNGTAGGTFTSGAWRTRDLNDVTLNTIVGASLATNRITLPAGTYLITASAPGRLVSRHKIKIANITDSSDEIIGSSALTNSTFDQTISVLSDAITLSGAKSIELQHRAETTRSTDGFGTQSSFSVVEIYAMIKIEKIG